MNEARKVFRPRFWITPTLLADDPRIEPFDEKVYAAVDWFHGMKDGECRASNITLAELIKPADPQPRSVQNSLTRLEECGYIRRDYKDQEKRNRLRIVPLIELQRVRNDDDTPKTSELAMTPVRNGDDRRVRNGDDQSNNNISNKRSKTHKGVCVPFEDFWKLYPRKVEKKKASAKWARVPCELHAQILADIEARKKSDQWTRGFIPHPTTYLNGERWNDEITSKTPAAGAKVDRF